MAIGGFSGQITDNGSLIIDYESFYQSSIPDSERAFVEHFNELQAANRITKLDFSNPNRIEVDIDVSEPAMLVLTEVWYPGWQALVDGEPAALYRVNYLQRGIWLGRGNHRVELVFRPRTWRIGAIISLISWSGLILALIGWGMRKLLRRRTGSTGYGRARR